MTTVPPAEHSWGDAPELYGPRHDYRESLVVRRIARTVLPGRDAVDAGAGAGSMALRLAAAGCHVTAVDDSPAFVDRLGRLLATAPNGPHRALRGDMTRLPVPDASAHLVVCAEVLEHIDDDAAATAELARVLRPAGLLVVTVPAGPERFDWTDEWAGHRRRYTRARLEGMLRGAGLVDVEVTAWGFPLTGLYHRRVYGPALRRRVERETAEGAPAGLGGPPHPLVRRLVRTALELDTAFMGRRPGYMGFIATARRPSAPAAR